MKFLHLADLHLGKSLHGLSLLESGDQSAWVEDFLELAEKVGPDAVLIAGDVYDRGAPSGDAVELLDRLLMGLREQGIPVLLCAGNHDSGQRLSFGGRLLAREGLHIAGVLRRELTRVTFTDPQDGQPVHVWLLPYVFPALVAQVLEDESIRDYETALRRLLAEQPIDRSVRNVLVAHQNVTAFGQESPRGGSESMVGGVGMVDYRVFDDFDYVALGHIHAAYPVGRPEVRYAGSPLCYHFEETRQAAKGPLLVELGPKGTAPRIETLSIAPLHPLRQLRGSYEELRRALLEGRERGEYLSLTLTHRRVSPEIAVFFREAAQARESQVLELQSDYEPFAAPGSESAPAGEEKSVERLFAEFYAERCGAEPEDEDWALLRCAAEQLTSWDGGPVGAEAVVRRALEEGKA